MGDRAASARIYGVLTGDDDPERACAAIPDSSCRAIPRNYLLNVANGACTKLAEQLANPGLVLPWLLAALGAPAVIAGYLVPIKQAGSLLPQLAVAARIRQAKLRKWFWVGAGGIQALSLLAMILAALLTESWVAGLWIAALMAVFSIASGVGSVAFQDVLGKTVPKGRRGRLLSHRAALGGALTLLAAVYLRYGLGTGESLAPYLYLVAAAALLWAFAALLLALIAEAPGATEGGRSMLGEVGQGLAFFRNVAPLRLFLGVRGLLLSVELATPFYALHAQDLYGEGVGALALFVFALGAANVVSSPFWGIFADAEARRVLALSGLIGAAAAGLALTIGGLSGNSNPYVYTAVFLLIGLAEAGVRLGRKTYLVDAAPDRERPLLVAFSNTLVGLLALVFGMLGLIADMAGPQAMLILLGALALGGAALALRLPASEDFLGEFNCHLSEA